MRPTVLLGCLWTIWSCASATAQPPQGRQSALRDSGVISRAAPPMSLGSNNSGESSPATSAFSDRAWTGSASPASAPTSPASASLSDSAPVAPVVSAQITSSDQQFTDGRNSVSGQPSSIMPASFAVPSTSTATQGPATQGQTATHEPKPLKPPTAAVDKADGKGSSGTVQMFVSVMSSLAIVIGLILAAAWCYRKAAPTISGALPKQVVQVLGRTPLAPRQQLVLLRLGSKLVLVSNLHGEVRTISEITDPLEVDRLAGLCEAAQPGSISESFRSVLHNIGRNG